VATLPADRHGARNQQKGQDGGQPVPRRRHGTNIHKWTRNRGRRADGRQLAAGRDAGSSPAWAPKSFIVAGCRTSRTLSTRLARSTARRANVAEFTDAISRIAAGGTALDPEVVRGLLNASRHTSALGTLTARERDVLALMAEGRSNSAIADHIAVSERAVEKHISNIFAKLGLPPSDSDHRRVLAVLAYLGTWSPAVAAVETNFGRTSSGSPPAPALRFTPNSERI
jgi:DNA-binding CsgD family transcriptional regulator